MFKLLIVVLFAIACFVTETTGQYFQNAQQRTPSLLTYRLLVRPFRYWPTRHIREVTDEPLWIYKDIDVEAPSAGEHLNLQHSIEDIDLNPNRRYARNIRRSYEPVRPRPSPFNPRPNPRPLRLARDLNTGGFRKPTHHTVVIPNWNPNVRTKPHQIIRFRAN